MGRLGRDVVHVTEPGRKTSHGNQVDDWDNPAAKFDIVDCYVELSVTDEDLVNRDATLAAGTVFASPGYTVSARARVTYEGTDYAVDGRALELHSFSGRIDYLPIPIKFWEG